MVDRLVGFIFGEHWNILLNDNCNDIWHTINIQRLQDTGFTRGLNPCWIWTKIVRIHDAEYTIKACSQNYHLSVIKPASWFILFVYLDTAPIIHIIHAYILISGLDIINDIRPIMTASHSFIIWIHPECVFFLRRRVPQICLFVSSAVILVICFSWEKLPTRWDWCHASCHQFDTRMSHVRIEHSSIYLLVFKIYVGDIPTSTVLLHHYPSTHPRSCKDISGLLLLFLLLLLYIYTYWRLSNLWGYPIIAGWWSFQSPSFRSALWPRSSVESPETSHPSGSRNVLRWRTPGGDFTAGFKGCRYSSHNW